MLLDLVAGVLASGAGPPRAVAAVADCLERAGDPAAAPLRVLAQRLRSGVEPRRVRPRQWTAADPSAPRRATSVDAADPAAIGADRLAAALEIAVSSGAGAAGLIRVAADEARRVRQAELVRAAHRLAVLVLLPTGLCLLPAFMLLTIVPLLLDLVLR